MLSDPVFRSIGLYRRSTSVALGKTLSILYTHAAKSYSVICITINLEIRMPFNSLPGFTPFRNGGCTSYQIPHLRRWPELLFDARRHPALLETEGRRRRGRPGGGGLWQLGQDVRRGGRGRQAPPGQRPGRETPAPEPEAKHVCCFMFSVKCS